MATKMLRPRNPLTKRRPRKVVIRAGYAPPPRELAGQWVAWSKAGTILANGPTLAEVVAKMATKPGVSYERLPAKGSRRP